MAARFRISRPAASVFTFQLIGGNGRVLLQGSKHSTEAEVRTAIAELKAAVGADGFVREGSEPQKFIYKIVNPAGVVLAFSEGYATAAGRDGAIDRVMELAPDAAIEVAVLLDVEAVAVSVPGSLQPALSTTPAAAPPPPSGADTEARMLASEAAILEAMAAVSADKISDPMWLSAAAAKEKAIADLVRALRGAPTPCPCPPACSGSHCGCACHGHTHGCCDERTGGPGRMQVRAFHAGPGLRGDLVCRSSADFIVHGTLSVTAKASFAISVTPLGSTQTYGPAGGLRTENFTVGAPGGSVVRITATPLAGQKVAGLITMQTAPGAVAEIRPR